MSISNSFTYFATEKFDGHLDHLADRLKLVGVCERTGGGFIPCSDFADGHGRRWREVGFLRHHLNRPHRCPHLLRRRRASPNRELRPAEMVPLGIFPELGTFAIEPNSEGNRHLQFAIVHRIGCGGRRRERSASAPERIARYVQRARGLLELASVDGTVVQA